MCSATLSTSTPGASVAVAASPYPDLAAGASGTNTTPFKSARPRASSAARPLGLTATVTTGQGTQVLFNGYLATGSISSTDFVSD